MPKLEDGVDVHKLTQVNKICAKTCTPNCYALQIARCICQNCEMYL